MIRNIVLDMGNVLLTYHPMLPCIRHCKDQEKAEAVYKVLFGDPNWGPVIDGGVMDEPEYWENAKKKLPTQELRDMADAVGTDWWLDALCPKFGMDKLLAELLDAGCKLYILSNCGFRFHDFSYKIPHLDRFSGILVSAEEKMLKPNAEIYERLCEKFNLKAEECVFIDDRQDNADGATAVGMLGYYFADGDVEKLRAYLKEVIQ